MITLRTGNYTNYDLHSLRNAFGAAISSFDCQTRFGKPDCTSCVYGLPCKELQSAVRHLDNLINNNKESENNETV